MKPARKPWPLLETLNCNRLSIIGHSGGGGIAQVYAAAHPEQVEALILLNSTFTVQETLLGFLLEHFGDLAFRITYHPLVHMSLKQTMLNLSPFLSFFTRQPLPLVSQWVEEFMDIPYWVAKRELRAILKFNGWPALEKIRAPTLIVGGERDPITPATMSKAMADRVENAELHILPNAGHLTPILHARETNDLIWSFLTENYPAPTPADLEMPPFLAAF